MATTFDKRRHEHDIWEEKIMDIIRPFTDRRHLPDRRVSFGQLPCSWDLKTTVFVEDQSRREYLRLWDEGELVFIVYKNGDGDQYGDGEWYADWVKYLDWIGPFPPSPRSTSGDDYYRIDAGRKLKLKDFLERAGDEVKLLRDVAHQEVRP